MADALKKKSEPKTSFLGRVARVGASTILTLGVVGAAAFLVQAGSAELTRRADAAPAPDAAAITPVETRPIVLEQGYEVTRSFIGQVEPNRTLSVSFELSGRLEEVSVDEGDIVGAGQPLAQLDTRLLKADQERLEANRTALEAQLRFAQQTVERQSQLNDRGFASQAALDEALSRTDELSARIIEIDASLMRNAIQIEKSSLYAPFGGTVSARFVDGGESVSPGQVLIDLVASEAPVLRIGVPLDVSPDDLISASVEIGGKAFTAQLTSLRPDIDPVTRTRTALFEISTANALAFGQTARLNLRDFVEEPGLWVPTTSLKEGLRGQWTLLAVDDTDTVRALSVQVVHINDDQVFVRGAFPKDARLISSGPQRVTVGQSVNPLPAS